MRRVEIEHLWLSVPVFVVVWIGFRTPLMLFDFWWHLKAGEIIVTSRSIPRTDIFSFTASGTPFILQNWLAEVFFYAVYRIGGFPLLIALNTALLVGTLLLVYYLCREATDSLRVSVIAASLVALSLSIYGNLRTQTFSFLFLAAFYWVLLGYRHRRRDFLWVLPLLMILWVNLHGAFVLGLGLVGLFLGCEGARYLTPGPRSDTLSINQLRRLGVILLLTVLASLVNPETFRIYLEVWTVLRDPASQLVAAEWQVPRIDSLQGILIFYGPFFATLLIMLLAERPPELTEFVLLIAFGVLAATARRNGIWLTLLVAPIVARYLPMIRVRRISALVLRLRGVNVVAHRMARFEDNQRARPRYGLNALLAGLMLSVTIIISPWIGPNLAVGGLGISLLEPATPVGAMNFIEKHGLRGNIFHSIRYGDYLIWRLWPQHRSFIDGRMHLFSESFSRTYLLLFEDPNWEGGLAPYNIRYLLLQKDSESSWMINDARISPRWFQLYEDDQSVLFERLGEYRQVMSGRNSALERSLRGPKSMKTGFVPLNGIFQG